MRIATIVGILLIGLGGYLFYENGSFSTREDVLKVGDLKVTAEKEHAVAPWMAGVAVLGGIVLVVAGVRSKT